MRLAQQQKKAASAERGIEFSEECIQLELLSLHGDALLRFRSAFAALAQLGSTLKELEALKPLTLALAELVERSSADDESAESCLSAFSSLASLLFAPNSRPLHRGLLSAMARLPAALHARAAGELERRLLALSAAAGSELLLADGLASVLAQQPASQPALLALHRAAEPVATALARGVLMLLERQRASAAPPPPAAVEACHSALGVMYALVQRHGARLSLHAAGEESLRRVAEASLACLLSPHPLSRESALTAAVVLVAAASLRLPPARCARELARALYPAVQAAEGDCPAPAEAPDEPPLQRSLLDALVPGGSLAALLLRPPPFSRLCLLKALLAAVPAAALTHGLRAADGSPWCLLLDGALPELCGVAESAACAHERYHAVSAVTQCAQRLAAGPGGGIAPPAALRARLESLAWGGWEDPQPQVVKSVHALFDALLTLEGEGGEGAAATELRLAQRLLVSGPAKGRWPPLARLLDRRRLPLQQLLAFRPCLLEEALGACDEETRCASAAAFVRALCSAHAAEGDPALSADRLCALLLGPLADALLGAAAAGEAGARVRAGVSSHVLPALLLPHPFLAHRLLDRLTALRGAEGDSPRLASAAVALLRPARALSLCCPAAGCGALLAAPGQPRPSSVCPQPLLAAAAAAACAATRLDCLELLCCSPRACELPAPAEAALLRTALSAALAGGAAAQRNRAAALLRRLLPRLRAGLERREAGDAAAREAARRLVPALLRAALRGAYPGAPFERTFAALDTLLAVAQSWPPGAAAAALAVGDTAAAWPYDSASLGEEWARALLCAGVDGWDRLRECAAQLLALHPAPLPGLGRAEQLQPLLAWLSQLVRSPRARESDAAARLWRLLAEKYGGLGWRLRLAALDAGEGDAPFLAVPPPPGPPAEVLLLGARVRLLEDLVALLRSELAAAERNPAAAARRAFCHGALLALRYSLPGMRLGSPELAAAEGGALVARVRAALAELLALLRGLLRLVLASVARPEEMGAGAAEVQADAQQQPGGGVGWGAYFGDAEGDESDAEGEGEGERCALAPRAQVIQTAAWLSAKEGALLLGALATCAPPRLLPPSQLALAGAGLLRALLASKHNGVVDKARAGLQELAQRLLRGDASGDVQPAWEAADDEELRADVAALRALDGGAAAAPRMWAEQLLARMEAPGQAVRDLIRRSAGLPPALLALCCAEPVGCSRHILPAALRRCLAAASVAAAAPELHVPGVHALNCLRLLLSDHSLSADTAGALQDALACALAGFASPQWAVRNAAGLLFASLCGRLTGGLNPRESSSLSGCKGRLSAPDFFARFPVLRGTLPRHLLPGAAALHPALALLSRLRPAEQLAGTDAAAEEAQAELMRLVRAAGCSRVHAVRALAARALASLLPPSQAAAGTLAILRAAPGGGGCNELHGDLMQAVQLLRSAAVAGTKLPAAGLVAAIDPLCRQPPHPPPILELLLRLLLVAARSAAGDAAAEEAAFALTLRCVEAAEELNRQLPGACLCLKRAAEARVVLWLRDAAADSQARLLAWLADSGLCYEARCEALKTLQRVYASSSSAPMLDRELLCATLLNVLDYAPACGHKVACHAAELLAHLCSAACDAGAAPRPGMWRSLSALLDGAARGDSRLYCAALRCLGLSVAGASAGAMESLLRCAEESADYACTADRRLASARSLEDSRILLSDAETEEANPLALRAWLLSVSLLQDEDPSVRSAAGVAVCAALRISPSPTPALLSRALNWCSARFGACAGLHAWLLDATTGRLELDLGDGEGGLVRRLFDREVDNHHAEAMRTAQLAARELGVLARDGRFGATARREAAEKVDAAASRFAAKLSRARASDRDWGAGLTCHECVFMPLYRLLLGVHALGAADGAGCTLLLSELRSEEADRKLHPLLSSMVAHLRLDGEAGREEPCFLLDSHLAD